MRILVCCPLSYYGARYDITLSYDLFVRVPRLLGHDVVVFDFIASANLDKNAMNDHFISLVKGGNFDFVIIETAGEQFNVEVLNEARSIIPIIAWNSDDDFRWNSYSKYQYPYFTLMYTTSMSVYKAVHANYPNLRYSQWGCTKYTGNSDHKKDIDVSFCGSMKSKRLEEISEINKLGAKMFVVGMGSNKIRSTWSVLNRIILSRIKRGKNSGFRKELHQWINAKYGGISNGVSYMELHNIWNRSKIIFTPLTLEPTQQALKKKQYEMLNIDTGEEIMYQCKSRIFEPGMSNALLLMNKTDIIEEYYVPGEEYLEYSSYEECVDLIKYYSKHENERLKLANNYRKATVANHLWIDRYAELIDQVKVIL